MAVTSTEVTEVYTGTFNRAPDADGLAYWVASGFTIEEIAASFFDQAETQALYPPGTTSTEYITSVYDNLFNRVPDDAGLAYWVDALDSGAVSRDTMLLAMINGATGNDQLIVDNKTETGLYYAETLKINGTYSLAAVTEDPATVTTVKADMDLYVPQTFTLTTGVDSGADFTGGLGDDIFTAEVLTANDGDSLDGGGGLDTLNVETASSLTSNFTTANIEIVNLNALGAVSVDTKNMTGLTTLNSNDAAGAVTINNIADATMAFGIKGSATNSLDLNYVTGTLNGDSDTLALTLNGSTATVITADSGFEAVTLAVAATSSLATLTASGASALTISGAAKLSVADTVIDSFTSFTISNTAKTTLGSIATVKTIDATANTDGIVQAQTASATLNNGTSNDKLAMHSAGGIVQTGAGNDIINVDSSAVFSTNSTIIKLGAGDDNLNISGVSSAGEYVYGQAGDDTIYVGAVLTAADLIDGGEGTDTLNFVTGVHSLIAKGIEAVNVEDTTSVTFVTTDTATAITDTTDTAETVSFANLLNGSTYTATGVKTTGDLSLGFKTSEAAIINIDLQKGMTGDITTTNAADVTVTYGAASNLAGTSAVTLDAIATKLTIDATGDLIGGKDIAASSASEKLQTLAITGTKDILMGDVLNDTSLTSVSVTTAGGSAIIGDIGAAANNKADTTVTKIEATSTVHEAIIGNIDFSGLATTVAGSIAEITATGVNGGTATLIGKIDADTIGTITATSTKNAVTVATGSTVTVGADTADTTDGTVTAIKVSGYLGASIADTGSIAADKIDSIVVESTDTTTGGLAELGAITDAKGGTKATLGTIDVSSAKAGAETNAITADALGNTTVSGATTAKLGATTVANAAGDSVTGNITVTSGTLAATLGVIDVEVAGTITAKATATGVVFNDMTFDDAGGVSVVLQGGTGSVAGAAAEVIDNTKGDITVTVQAGTTFAAGAKQTINGGTAAATNIDMVVNASAVTGNVGATGGATNLTIENEALDAASSMSVTGGKAANFITLDADGGTVAYQGQGGADTVALAGTYTSSTINAEGAADIIVGGAGADTINAGTGADKVTASLKADTIDFAIDADADIFYVNDTASAAGAMDSVKNFIIANDTIDAATGVGAATIQAATDVTAAAGTTNGIATGMFTFDKAAATSLSDAISKVGVDVATAGDSVIFEYGGNTYFFSDVDGAATTATDIIVELVGVDSTSMAEASDVFTIS